MKKRAVTYARVSGNDKAKTGGENLAEQTRICREYAVKQGYFVVENLAENDRGASGATFDLPQLSEALRMAHANEYDVLIVRELDRLSRDLAKQLVVEQELKQAGVTIAYVLYDFPDTPEGRLNKNLRAMLAEYEREKIKQRLMRGRNRSARAGNVVLHGHAPYGYKAVQKDDRATLEIEEESAKIVRLIFEWYTVGDGEQPPMSVQSIKRALTALKIPTSSDLKNCSFQKRVTGYGDWNTTSIWRMLRSTTYIGVWHYGADDIPVKVPAIISKGVWDMAQARMQQNKQQNKRNTRYEYLLQSRLRCAECHNMVRTAVRRSRSGKSVRLYYHCQTQDRDLHCTNVYYYRAELVDYLAWEWIRELLSKPDKLRKGLYDYKSQQDELTRPLRNRLALVENMIQEEHDKRKRMLDVYKEGHITKDEFVEYQQKYDQVVAGLIAQRAEIMSNLQGQEDLDEDRIRTILKFAKAIQEEVEDAKEDFQTKRYYIRLFRVTGEIAFEDNEKVVYFHCIVDNDKRVSLSSYDTSSKATASTARTGTTTSAHR